MKANSFAEGVQHLRGLLDSCEFDSALETAARIEARENHELRTLGHMVGKIAFRKGDFAAAIVHFQNTEAAYGEYIGLTCDIASAHYMLENFEAFEIESRRAIVNLKKIRHLLSPESLIRTSLSLSKFCEELGLISDAVQICEDALASFREVEIGSLESPRLLLRAQVLRLHAQFNSPIEKIRHHYRAILQLSKTKQRLFQYIDVQHALIIAETRLLSLVQALDRLNRFMSRPTHGSDLVVELNEADARLCYFDLLAEGMLISSGPWVDIQKIPFMHLTFFEQTVWHLQNGTEVAPIGTNVRIPLAQRLLLLALSKGLSIDEDLKQAAARQLEILLSTLEDSDRALWEQRLNMENSPCSEILYSSVSGRLTYGTTSFRIAGKTTKRIFELLLEASRTSQSVTTSNLADYVWSENYTVAHYERLRIGTQRLNASLSKLTGRRDNIIFTKIDVCLNPDLKFRR